MTCTFFGHREVPSSLEPRLHELLVRLVKEQNVRQFYVGNHGGFDAMVRRELLRLRESYPISFAVVLAYLPTNKLDGSTDTVLPDGIERVPRRFAISYRNRWMIKNSDLVISYITDHTMSSAAQFVELAARQGKRVVPLGK